MTRNNIDDIFDMMDRVFGPSHPSTNPSRKRRIHINPDRYERLIDDDNIYYTFELREFNKEDINIECIDDAIRITFNNERYYPYNLKLPYPILDKKMKITFRNGILDIICPIDKKQRKKLDIS